MNNDPWKYHSIDHQTNHYSSDMNWYLYKLNKYFDATFKAGDIISIDESMALCKSRYQFDLFI